jgi:hypothetical protein
MPAIHPSMKLKPTLLFLLPVLLVAAGCTSSPRHRGGYLLARGFAAYEKENPLARASALAVSPEAVAGVAPNKSGDFYFFRGDLRTGALYAEPVPGQQAGEERLARFEAENPAAWRRVGPQSPEARSAMRVLKVAAPRRTYSAATGSRLGDDRPVEAITDIKPHNLKDGGGNFRNDGN